NFQERAFAAARDGGGAAVDGERERIGHSVRPPFGSTQNSKSPRKILQPSGQARPFRAGTSFLPQRRARLPWHSVCTSSTYDRSISHERSAPMATERPRSELDNPDRNPDPITCAPGAHPVDTG